MTTFSALVNVSYYDQYEEHSDEKLIEDIKQGNIYAEEYLYMKYLYLIKKAIGSFFMLGGDQDDLFQEALIGFYKATKDYNKTRRSSFRTFAELCIKRQIITAVRQAARQKHSPLNNYISINTQVYEDNDSYTFLDKYVNTNVISPERLIIGNEQAEIIQELIKRILSDFEKEVLNHYIDGKSYSEISDIMNKEVKSIDNALQRVKKKILEHKVYCSYE